MTAEREPSELVELLHHFARISVWPDFTLQEFHRLCVRCADAISRLEASVLDALAREAATIKR